MRLVRFEDPSGGFAIDLHPMLTVVSGLSQVARNRLVAGVTALPRGGDPGGTGSIEVHGVFLELSAASLELLDLHQELDVVLRRGDLPGAERQVAPTPSLFPPDRPSHDDAAAGDEGVSRARVRLDAAETATLEAQSGLERIRERLNEVGVTRADVLSRLEGERGRLDPFAVAGLKVARDELASLIQASNEAHAGELAERREGALAAERSSIEAQLEELISTGDQLRREIARLCVIDPVSVRSALDQIERADRPTLAVSPEAEALLDEWIEFTERRSTLDARRAGGRSQLGEVTARRDRAYDEFVEAERALRAPRLDPKLVDELEMVHDEVFDLDGRTGKIGGAKLRRRQEELKIHESKLLAQLGYDTWSSYVMGLGSGGADVERAHRFHVTQASYQLAEDELARVAMMPVLEDPQVRDLEELNRSLGRRIVDLLGHDPGPDPTGALASYREQVPTVVGVDMEMLVERLRSALVSTGAELPEGSLLTTELLSIANGWLDAMAALPARIRQAEVDHAAIEAEIAELAERLEMLEAQPPTTVAPVAARVSNADVEAAEERVADCARRARLHEEAVERIESLQREEQELASTAEAIRAEAEHHGAVVEERAASVDAAAAALETARDEARARVAATEAARVTTEAYSAGYSSAYDRGSGDAMVQGGSATTGVDAVEWYVLARLAQQRSVSFVGSMPLVVDEAFSDWPFDELNEVFARLERMSEVIQIVFLTVDPAVVGWARNLGVDRATVIESSPAG